MGRQERFRKHLTPLIILLGAGLIGLHVPLLGAPQQPLLTAVVVAGALLCSRLVYEVLFDDELAVIRPTETYVVVLIAVTREPFTAIMLVVLVDLLITGVFDPFAPFTRRHDDDLWLAKRAVNMFGMIVAGMAVAWAWVLVDPQTLPQVMLVASAGSVLFTATEVLVLGAVMAYLYERSLWSVLVEVTPEMTRVGLYLAANGVALASAALIHPTAYMIVLAGFSYTLHQNRIASNSTFDLFQLRQLLELLRDTPDHEDLGEVLEPITDKVGTLLRSPQVTLDGMPTNDWDGARHRQLNGRMWMHVARPAGSRGWHANADAWLDEIAAAVADTLAAFEQRRALREAAERDHLTGLANRRALNATIQRNIDAGTSMALLFLDLNAFKPVNDTYGHDAGDQVLCALSRRLEQVVRDGDVVARIGGDEFCLLLSGTTDSGVIRSVTARVHEAVDEPIQLGGGVTVTVGTTVGHAIHEKTMAADDLVDAADQAMYALKSPTGRGDKDRSSA